MNTIIATATNNALVVAHIKTITRKTGSARSFRWENLVAVLS